MTATPACGARTWTGNPCQRQPQPGSQRCPIHKGRKAMSPPKPDPRRPHLNDGDAA